MISGKKTVNKKKKKNGHFSDHFLRLEYMI